MSGRQLQHIYLINTLMTIEILVKNDVTLESFILVNNQLSQRKIVF